MREMIFRERQEKVAHMDAMAKMVARVFGVDASKMFGDVVSDYASEVFQESYDADLLREKIAAIRAAQERIIARRKHDEGMIERLERMGEFYDRNLQKDVVKPPVKK
jgi:hypothetical protein